jgi:nicotinate-nucleotide adenylyltransferase
VGHVVAAATARHALGLDEVLLTVANRPWQKVGTRVISSVGDRLAMVEALVADTSGLVASDLEIARGGDSYTADTIADLQRDGERPVFVIVGADAAGAVGSWARADEVRDTATLVLVDRPGLEGPPVPPGWAFERVHIPRLDISSTEIRRRVAAGEPIDGLVPSAVRSVIEARGLYR